MAEPEEYAVLWNEQRLSEIEMMRLAAAGKIEQGYFEDNLMQQAAHAMAHTLIPRIVVEKRGEGGTPEAPRRLVYRFTMAVLRSATDLMAWTRELAAERRAGARDAAAYLDELAAAENPGSTRCMYYRGGAARIRERFNG